MAGDHGQDFVPDSDGQWVTVTATFPAWNLAASAELGVRLRRNTLLGGQHPEAFYLDDLRIGEAEVSTGIAAITDSNGLIVWPNPATDGVRIQRPDAGEALVRLVDATGRTVHQRTITGMTADLDLASIARGTYVLVLQGSSGPKQVRLLVQ
jgi:hypothetical protein